MNYRILTAPPDENLLLKWREFLEHAEFATHYTTANFFADPYIRGGERFAVLTFDENENITAVLTGVDDGKKITSGMAVRPQTAFRKNADLRETAKNLLSALKEKGGENLELINFYTWQPIREFEEAGFQTQISSEQNLIILVDLAKGAEQIFKEFSQTRRSELRKAMKQNLLEVKTLETEAELKELYEIHVEWNARKGNQPDSFAEMKLAAAQTENRKIFIAKHEGKVVAGSYYRFCKNGIVEYAANNSLTEFQKLRPNDLIGWRSLEWACENNFSHYSMGGSHLFLRRFGGGEWAAHRYKMDLSRLKIHNFKENVFDLGIKTYQRLPVSVKSKIKKIAGKN